MPIGVHPPETDLLMPLPGPGERWDAHLIHTHYFGFCVPEAAIGAFVYFRYQPAFPLSQGGVVIFQGLDNVQAADCAYLDYEMTMPWPAVDANSVTLDNGLRVEFLELGGRARLTYTSADGSTSLDVVADAVTPLLARGHVMPGEDDHHAATRALGSEPGGSEQFMHMTGELVLHGERHVVDCHYPRDRSWRQVRVEKRGAVPAPPMGWSPMHFGPDLVVNQVGFEPLDTDPAWAGLYDMGERPSHHYAWIRVDGESRAVKQVRRNVLERHPQLYVATRQELEILDERGDRHLFQGQAIAAAPLPAWPNVSFQDSVYRWTDEAGRATYCTYQEVWFDRFHRAMKAGRTR